MLKNVMKNNKKSNINFQKKFPSNVDLQENPHAICVQRRESMIHKVNNKNIRQLFSKNKHF